MGLARLLSRKTIRCHVITYRSIVQYLRDQFQDLAGFGLAFANLRRISPTPKNIFRHLLKQALSQTDTHWDQTQDLYGKHNRTLKPPPFKEVVNCFLGVLEGFTKFFIVLDGLDKLEDRTQLALLNTLKIVSTSANILIGSRPHLKSEINQYPQYLTIRVPELLPTEGQAKNNDGIFPPTSYSKLHCMVENGELVGHTAVVDTILRAISEIEHCKPPSTNR
jgi:hypothetical protein